MRIATCFMYRIMPADDSQGFVGHMYSVGICTTLQGLTLFLFFSFASPTPVCSTCQDQELASVCTTVAACTYISTALAWPFAMTARCQRKWEGAWPENWPFAGKCWLKSAVYSYRVIAVAPESRGTGPRSVLHPFCQRCSLRGAQGQPQHILEFRACAPLCLMKEQQSRTWTYNHVRILTVFIASLVVGC